MKFVFAEAWLREMARKFRELDIEHTETLDEDVVTSFLETHSKDPIMAKVSFRLFDLDKDGALSFAEFALFLKGLELLESNPIEFYRLVFNSVDVNDAGELDSNEFALFCNLLGMDESIEEAATLISKLTHGLATSITFEQLYSGMIQPLAHRSK
jgi:Ca2+-binding EF-hand superfamily protein